MCLNAENREQRLREYELDLIRFIVFPFTPINSLLSHFVGLIILAVNEKCPRKLIMTLLCALTYPTYYIQHNTGSPFPTLIFITISS